MSIRSFARRPLAMALLLGIAVLLPLFLARPAPASAHPLANFSVNTYSRFDLYSDSVRLRYIVDMAELPAYLEIEEAIDLDHDGAVSPAEERAYLDAVGPALAANLSLALNGRPAPLDILGAAVAFPPGDGGLPLVRIVLVLEAPAASGPVALAFDDANYPERAGWREAVLVAAPGVALQQSSVPAADRSRELTAYPDQPLSDAPADRSLSASFTVGAGSPAPAVTEVTTAYSGDPAAAAPAAAPRASDPFASLVARDDLSLTVLLGLLATALVFGALHALEPGHGKTIVAGYFVVARGTSRQAILLGLLIGVTHSVGVIAIGLVTLYGSQYILPEHLYPWLRLASGVMVIGLGLWLLLSRVRGIPSLARVMNFHLHLGPARHSHAEAAPAAQPGGWYRSTFQPDTHRHAFGRAHTHAPVRRPTAPTPDADARPPWKPLITLGLIDGLVPTPSTIVVLVAAIALDRLLLGLALVVAFSFGLAIVLTAASLSALWLPRFLAWLRRSDGPLRRRQRLAWLASSTDGAARAGCYLPVLGAAVFLILGAYLTLQAVADPMLLG